LLKAVVEQAMAIVLSPFVQHLVAEIEQSLLYLLKPDRLYMGNTPDSTIDRNELS
jgi:hypothetical protein